MLSIVFASTRAARLRLAFPVIVASTMATLGASACGRDTELPGPPPPPPPHATCAIAVTEPGPGKDLFVSGDPSCGAAVTASVRVATGDPSVPVWTELARAPIAVEGAWEPAEGGLRRKVRVTNRGASAMSLVGLE